MRRLYYLLFMFFLCSCGNTIYIVRHAEKETGNDPATNKPYTDPPLTYEGQERALKLKEILSNKGITHIYSTKTVRTISTATPLKEMTAGLPINIYSPRPDSTDKFIQMIKEIKKGGILIVGHSNTVDDLCNKIAGTTVVAGDLKDSEYDNLFILKRKGSTYKFNREKYGKPSQ